VLIAAKQRGKIPSVAPLLDRLIATGYRLSAPLCREVLAQAGEACGS
jgi:predicted nucleic acid-binding protein